MSLAPSTRREIESYVRPLYVELDGIDTFGNVERREAVVGGLLGEREADREYLELLLLFHGSVKSLGSTDPRGRWWLLLRGLGIPEQMIRRLSIGLGRWREDPRGPEEEALHDAELLEQVGVVACAQQLWRAGRKRVALPRAVSTLNAGPAPERFKTSEGRRLAAAGRGATQAWIDVLRQAVGKA